jgi:hypothetical protein
MLSPIRLVLFLALLLGKPAFAHAAAISVIYSYPPGEWFHGIHETLKKSSTDLGLGVEFVPIIFHAEYWARRPEQETAKEKERILGILRKQKPKAVILCDDEASDVFANAVHDLKLPTFFLGVNRELSDIPWWNTVKESSAIVLERYPVEQLLQATRRMLPRARRISVVTSLNATSGFILPGVVRDVESANQRLGGEPFSIVDTFRSEKWQDWKAYLGEVRQKADLVWILIPYDVHDHHGTEVPIERMGRWLRNGLELPSLGLSSIHPKMGVLLTVAMTPQQLARASVSQIARWLKGTPLVQIPPQTERMGHLQVNSLTAKRLRLRIPKEILSASTLVQEPHLPYGR